jgi:UTP:GlnB (protein PII) uridylyltransferase
MISRQHFAFHIHQKPNVPYHKITIEAPWRKVRYVLRELRNIPVDVRKAHITRDHTTLYLKNPDRQVMNNETKLFVYHTLMQGIDIAAEQATDEMRNFAMHKIQMPDDVSVMIHNVPNAPYTLLEFTCGDRVGLLNDILDIMASLPIDIETGHISSVGKHAHNVFYLCRHDKPLSEHEIAYVANVFEHDTRNKTYDLQIPNM